MRVPALALLIAASLAGAAQAQQLSDQIAPEAATGTGARQIVTAETQMVSAANPLAAQAGIDILRAGAARPMRSSRSRPCWGSSSRNPRASAAGRLRLWYDAETGEVTTYDARETAPGAAGPDLFPRRQWRTARLLRRRGRRRSVGVPGVPRLLEKMHAEHGRLDWAALFDPAIELAEDGFAVSPRLAGLLEGEIDRLDRQEAARRLFLRRRRRPSGRRHPAGQPGICHRRCAPWPRTAPTPFIPAPSPRRSSRPSPGLATIPAR